MNKLKEILMRVGVLVGSLLGRVLPMKQNVDKLSEEEIVHGKDTIVAKKGRKESKRRTQRGGSKELHSRDSQSSSEVRRQPKKSKLSSKDGGNERSRKGLEGKANKTSSQSKSLGSIKQSRRKTKSGSNIKKK